MGIADALSRAIQMGVERVAPAAERAVQGLGRLEETAASRVSAKALSHTLDDETTNQLINVLGHDQKVVDGVPDLPVVPKQIPIQVPAYEAPFNVDPATGVGRRLQAGATITRSLDSPVEALYEMPGLEDLALNIDRAAATVTAQTQRHTELLTAVGKATGYKDSPALNVSVRKFLREHSNGALRALPNEAVAKLGEAHGVPKNMVPLVKMLDAVRDPEMPGSVPNLHGTGKLLARENYVQEGSPLKTKVNEDLGPETPSERHSGRISSAGILRESGGRVSDKNLLAEASAQLTRATKQYHYHPVIGVTREANGALTPVYDPNSPVMKLQQLASQTENPAVQAHAKALLDGILPKHPSDLAKFIVGAMRTFYNGILWQRAFAALPSLTADATQNAIKGRYLTFVTKGLSRLIARGNVTSDELKLLRLMGCRSGLNEELKMLTDAAPKLLGGSPIEYGERTTRAIAGLTYLEEIVNEMAAKNPAFDRHYVYSKLLVGEDQWAKDALFAMRKNIRTYYGPTDSVTANTLHNNDLVRLAMPFTRQVMVTQRAATKMFMQSRKTGDWTPVIGFIMASAVLQGPNRVLEPTTAKAMLAAGGPLVPPIVRDWLMSQMSPYDNRGKSPAEVAITGGVYGLLDQTLQTVTNTSTTLFQGPMGNALQVPTLPGLILGTRAVADIEDAGKKWDHGRGERALGVLLNTFRIAAQFAEKLDASGLGNMLTVPGIGMPVRPFLDGFRTAVNNAIAEKTGKPTDPVNSAIRQFAKQGTSIEGENKYLAAERQKQLDELVYKQVTENGLELTPKFYAEARRLVSEILRLEPDVKYGRYNNGDIDAITHDMLDKSLEKVGKPVGVTVSSMLDNRVAYQNTGDGKYLQRYTAMFELYSSQVYKSMRAQNPDATREDADDYTAGVLKEAAGKRGSYEAEQE